MPSLKDKLNGTSGQTLGRVNGQLRNVNNSEIQSLSAERGLSQSPTSPLAAQLLGASDDSAKMAGTPAQKAASFNVDPNARLRDVERRKQSRSRQTLQETLTQEKSQALQAAGAIGDSVHNLIQSYIPNQAIGQLTGDSSYEVALSPDVLASLDDQTKQQLEQLALNPSVEGAAALAPALEAAGLKGDASNPLQYINLKETGQSAAELISDPSTVTVGNLFSNGQFAEQSGLSQPELAELLGIDEVKLSELTVPELNDQIRLIEQEEFARVEELRNVVSDPSSSASERRQARQLLNDLGATGVVASEADVDQLIQKVDEADTLTFGDEVISVEDFLSDENLSNLTREYLDADEETKAKFSEKYGSDFTNFIQQHQAALEAASDQLDDLNTEVDTIQEENEALGEVEGLGKLDSELLESIIPGYGEFNFDKLEAPPILEAINNPAVSTVERQRIADSLSELNDLSPELAQLVADYSIEDLKSLGALDERSPEWNNHIQFLKTDYQLDNLDPEDPDYSRLVIESYFENGSTSLEDVQKQLDLSNQLGLENRPEALNVFDTDGDGEIDDIESIRKRLEDSVGSLTSSDSLISSEHSEFAHHFSDGEISIQEASSIFTSGEEGRATIYKLAEAGNEEAITALREDPQIGADIVQTQFEGIFPSVDSYPTDLDGNVDYSSLPNENVKFLTREYIEQQYLGTNFEDWTADLPRAPTEVRGVYFGFNEEAVLGRVDLMAQIANTMLDLVNSDKLNSSAIRDEYTEIANTLRANAQKLYFENRKQLERGLTPEDWI